MAPSTYYEYISRSNKPQAGGENKEPAKRGRKKPGFSLTVTGEMVCDEQIEEWICDIIGGEGMFYGYMKISAELREEHGLMINKKKVYRLCKELGALFDQREVKSKHPKKVAKKDIVSGPNEQWQLDVKYGYIRGTGQFFFQLSVIDVFDREVICYHIGLRCTGHDAARVLRRALKIRGLSPGGHRLKVRTDNGPQFISKAFREACEGHGVTHERIPAKTPNLNAYIESFHSILERECYGVNEFESFAQAYAVVGEYMEFYNERRRHGSLMNKSPRAFREALAQGSITMEPFAA